MTQPSVPDSKVDRIRDSLANALLVPSKFIGSRRLDSRLVAGPPLRLLRMISLGLSIKVSGEQRLQHALDSMAEQPELTKEEVDEQMESIRSKFIDYEAFEAAYDQMRNSAYKEDWGWAKRQRAADALRDAHRKPPKGG